MTQRNPNLTGRRKTLKPAAMGAAEQLKAGMTMEQVRQLLRGWREDLPSAFLSPDKTHLFYTLDFVPPPAVNEKRVRMTFDNGRLLYWGDPANADTGSESESA